MPRRIGGFAVGLLALFGFVVLYGLLTAYKYTISVVLNWVAFVLAQVRIDAWRVHIAPFAFLSDAIKDADAYVAATIGAGALRCEKIAVRFFHAIAHLASLLGHLIGDLAVTMLHALQVLRHRIIPRLIHAAVSILRRLLAKLWKWVRHAFAAVLHRLLRFVKWARHVVGSIVHRIAGIYKWARHAFGSVLHQIAGLFKLFRWLRGQLSVKNLKRLLIAALFALGLEWLFALNVIRLVKRVVRWSHRFVDSLLYAFGKVDGNTTAEVFAKVAQQEVHTVLRVLELLLADYSEHKIAPRYKDKLPPTV